MRIMYVEDNQVNLGLVVRIAKMGNHEVINFPDGSEALKALETEPVDLILMDIELEGELDGIEVVKHLRARGDKRPIVAITAYAMVGDKERILEAGCDDYLPKPLPVAQFLNILSKYDPDKIGATKDRIPAAINAPKVDESKPMAEAGSAPDSVPTATKAMKDDTKSKPKASAGSVDKTPPQEQAVSESPKPVTKTDDKKAAAEVKKVQSVENAIPSEKTADEPDRDPEATIPFDPEQLEAEIKAEREAVKEKEEKEDSSSDQSAELQAERESHDKSDHL